MTWKTGDTISLPIFFETAAGVAVVYANLAAFTAASGAFVFYQQGAAIASPPTPTLTPLGVTGRHWLTFVLPAGVDTVVVTKPSGVYPNWEDALLITPNDDTDSVASTLAGTVGTPVAGSAFSAYDFVTVEGDTFVEEFTVPTASLMVFDSTLGKYQFTDLSDIGGQPWTIRAYARGAWNQDPAQEPDFEYDAVISDKVACTVCIGFEEPNEDAVVVKQDGEADTAAEEAQTVRMYDIELTPPTGSTYEGRILTVIVGSHTIRRQQTTPVAGP